MKYLKNFVWNLKNSNIKVSAFIDPLGEQINYSKEIGFDFIELHTGKYAELSGSEQCKELQRIIESAPPNSAKKANCTGSGSTVFLACLTFAIWSMFTPNVAIIFENLSF